MKIFNAHKHKSLLIVVEKASEQLHGQNCHQKH